MEGENKPEKARHNYFMRTVLSKVTAEARRKDLTTRLIRQGIPPELRGTIWELCCGARRKCASIEQFPESSLLSRSYADLVSYSMQNHTVGRGDGVDDEDATGKSIPEAYGRLLSGTFRTKLKGGSLFETVSGSKRLRRVLYAFAVRRPDIGYCQAMNFVAAVLLTHMSEEAAFWALAAVVEDLVPGYYSASLVGVRRDAQVFAGFLEKKMPALFAHCQALNLMYEPLIMNWFLCIYINTLPFHTALRVWDCFLHEGVKVLFRVGLIIMKVLEPQLLAAPDFSSLWGILTEPMLHIQRMQNGGAIKAAEGMDNDGSGHHRDGDRGSMADRLTGDALIEAAFRYTDIGTMSTKQMEELRKRYSTMMTSLKNCWLELLLLIQK